MISTSLVIAQTGTRPPAPARRTNAATHGTGSAAILRMARSQLIADDAEFLTMLDELNGAVGVDPHFHFESSPLDTQPARPPASVGRGWMALNVVGFLLMAGLGAAGAALVFQDRLALLLR